MQATTTEHLELEQNAFFFLSTLNPDLYRIFQQWALENREDVVDMIRKYQYPIKQHLC